MASPEPEPSRVVVHQSVLASLWLPETSGYRTASKLLHEEVAQRKVALVAPSNLRFLVLSSLATAFEGDRLVPSISQQLYEDVSSILHACESEGLLRLVGLSQLTLSAFLLSAEFGLRLEDGLCAMLAISTQHNLLVAEAALATKLAAVAEAFPELKYRDLSAA